MIAIAPARLTAASTAARLMPACAGALASRVMASCTVAGADGSDWMNRSARRNTAAAIAGVSNMAPISMPLMAR